MPERKEESIQERLLKNDNIWDRRVLQQVVGDMRGNRDAKAWKDIWAAGQGVGLLLVAWVAVEQESAYAVRLGQPVSASLRR